MISKEEQKTSRIRMFVQLPSMEWIRDIAERERSHVARLYYLTVKLGAIITVVSGAEGRVEIAVVPTTVEPFLTQMRQLPGLAALPSERASALFEKLDDCGAWSLADCCINSRDGLICFHGIAAAEKEHFIYMDDPNWHPDPRYVQLLNCYSHEFLNDMVTMKHSPHPEYVLRSE